ncbi:MAG: hypothetical protein J7M24_08220, partial [Candidatus Latescibacteria bacterium]|nr:hypothetical protein [Candidatus Latescibacterota bacterium]
MNTVAATVVLMCACILSREDACGQEGRRGEVVFDRNDKVLNWKTNNSGSFRLSDKADFTVDSSLSTSLNMTTGSARDRWYDKVDNRAALDYRISEKFEIGFNAREEWNRDTMSRLGKSLLTTNGSANLRYRPIKALVLNADLGRMYDRRFENHDSGIVFKGGLGYDGKPLSGMEMTVDGSGETSSLKRSRDVFSGKGRLSYRRNEVTYGLALTDDYTRRGYFSDIDRSTIEKRRRREQTLALMMSRGDLNNLGDNTALDLSIDLGSKIITDSANDNSKSSKYKNNADGGVKGFSFLAGKRLLRRISARWGVDYSKNKNGVERLNRRRTQTDLETLGRLAFGIGGSDSIQVNGWVKRTRIDTPVGVANDRDELKLEGGVLYLRRFSERFETELDFRVLKTHYVNIDVSQSSQNKWMKTYLLSPSLVWSPRRGTRVRQTVNLYADYNAYDFDSDFRPRSNISRRVTSETWVDHAVSDRTRVQAGVMFEENDYGLLNSAGDKLPAEEGLKRFGDVSVEYVFTDWLTLRPSYIYSIRRDWTLSEDRTTPLRREVDQTYGLECRLFS